MKGTVAVIGKEAGEMGFPRIWLVRIVNDDRSYACRVVVEEDLVVGRNSP